MPSLPNCVIRKALGFLLLLQSFCTADSVLLIIADDLGRDSLAKFNDDPQASFPPTPTLDDLAENGIILNRAYAYSTCSPTRASILTGRYDFRTGVRSPEINTLQPNEFTLAEAIVASGKLGERLAHFGKWHLGNTSHAPNEIGGWPHFAGALGGGLPNYNRWTKVTNGVSQNRYATYATTDVVNDALAWIDSQGSQNWFAWLAFNAPHSPYHKPNDDLHDYDSLSGTEEDIAANPRPYYEAMVQAMDTEIGRLLQAVDLTTTTVIFMGDNGTPNGVLQSPFGRRHGKGSLYEGGINVPMIICGGAVDEAHVGTTNETIIHSVDLYQTILDLLEIDTEGLLPPELIYNSQSFYPVLTGTRQQHTRSMAYSAQPGSDEDSRSITLTTNDYKWILEADGDQEFYLRSDGLSETQNRIQNLDTESSAALAVFQESLELLENIPTIYQSKFDSEGVFTIEVGWFANASLSLQRTEDLGTDSWQDVEGAIITEHSGSTIQLSDRSEPTTQRFYRVIRN